MYVVEVKNKCGGVDPHYVDADTIEEARSKCDAPGREFGDIYPEAETVLHALCDDWEHPSRRARFRRLLGEWCVVNRDGPCTAPKCPDCAGTGWETCCGIDTECSTCNPEGRETP